MAQDCDANGLSVIHLRENANANTDKMEEDPYDLNVNQISCIAAAGFDTGKGRIGGSTFVLFCACDTNACSCLVRVRHAWCRLHAAVARGGTTHHGL